MSLIDALGATDTSRGAHLLDNMLRHAECLHAEDGPGLVEVAKVFAVQGSKILAAEAAAQAATILAASGDPVPAARAETQSYGWEHQCQQPKTPALDARPASVTARERQLALDAARGLTSQEIADTRYISTRTVDNHLGSVYQNSTWPEEMGLPLSWLPHCQLSSAS